MAKAKAIVGITMTMEDGSKVKVFEGDIIRGLVYQSGKEQFTIDECCVRVISGTTRAQAGGPPDCPPEPYLYNYINATMIVADSSDDNHAVLDRIYIASIVSVAEVIREGETSSSITIGPGFYYKSLSEIIAGAEPGTVINLQPGEYPDPLVVTKDVTIIGSKEGETVLSGAISVAGAADSEPIKLSISNVKLTGNATINITKNVGAFTMTDCTFENHTFNASKVMLINVSTNEPILMTITGNKFGDQTEAAYNLFELHCDLMDGSQFSGNTFTATAAAHNYVSMYGLDSGANVFINNNRAKKSDNMVRIGFRGAPKGTVNMSGNRYESTNPEYPGLFLIQPYKTETLTMKGLTVIADENVKPKFDEPLGYLYAAESATQFTKENAPTVVIDGEIVVFSAEMPADTVIPCVV